MAPPNRRLQENPTLAEAGRTLADTDIVVVVTDPDGDPVDVRVPVGDLPGGGGGASDAADVTFTPAGTISSTDVQAALEELDNDVVGAQDDASTAISGLAAHLADTSDAHDASAVSFVPGSGIAATTVQEAVEEAKNDATAYADSAISTHAAATDPHGDRAYAAGLVDDLSGVTNAATARTNLGVGTAATLASDTDGTLAANSDTAVATQKATKTYADTKLSTSTAAATYQPLDADLTTLATPGSAGQVPVSNGSAIAWGAAGGTTIPHTAQTADYTLALADAGTVVEMNKATAVTVTIPLNATVAFPVDTCISIQQMGAGTVTVAATGGVTIVGGSVFTVAQYGMIVLRKRATDEWVVAANAGSAVQVGELGYAAITADVTQVGAGNALVTGMSSTVTTTSRPVMVGMSAQIKHGTSGSTITLTLEEDGTTILSAEFTAAAANQSVPVERSIRRFPTAGSHTYRCRVTTTGTGTGTVMASSTSPAWVNVIQV